MVASAAAALLALMPVQTSAVSPGTEIENTALAAYSAPGWGEVSAPSNTVTITTVVARTPSTLEFLRYAPAYPGAEWITVPITEHSTSGSPAGPFVALPPPFPACGCDPLDLAEPLPLFPTSYYRQCEPVFVRLTDLDQNLDSEVRETVLVSLIVQPLGESELLRLTEIAPDAGVFVGYIQSDGDLPATTDDGVLSVENDREIDGSYTDTADPSDTSEATARGDTGGLVFDSRTGLPVDGAIITIVHAESGEPATVFGDDGVSSYPSTLVSGGEATDGSGNVHDFPPGEFHYPTIPPGEYRLVVESPEGYVAPSSATTEDLQVLPGAPFAIAEPGSRGEPFTAEPGPSCPIDLPVDPAGSSIFVAKAVNRNVAGVGDFLEYRVLVENTSAAPLMDLLVVDELPPGFRYRPGTTEIDAVDSPDPTISQDGRVLTFELGELPGEATAAVRYVVEVGTGAGLGEATNRAQATGANDAVSNVAWATVWIVEDLFGSRCFIVGRVAVGECDGGAPTAGDVQSASAAGLGGVPVEPVGVPGVRVILEDGTYVLTDPRGMFHFDGVPAGVHVVQLDLDTVPEAYEVALCEGDDRFAGRAFSQFVDLAPGTIWRTDFRLVPRPRLRGEVSLTLSSRIAGDRVAYGVEMENGAVSLSDLRLTVMLPEGAAYVPGSSRLGGVGVADPEIAYSALTYRIGDAPGGWRGALSFRAGVDAAKVPVTIVEGAGAVTRRATELVTKAVLIFDAPGGDDLRTPVVANALSLAVEDERLRRPDLVLRPRFETFSASLTEEDRESLDRAADELGAHDFVHLSVVGHTDTVRIAPGSTHIYADNTALSLARAESVARHLSDALGLARSDVTVEGRGESEPVAPNATAEGRALNRRVEVRVLSDHVGMIQTVSVAKGRDEATLEVEGARPGEQLADAGAAGFAAGAGYAGGAGAGVADEGDAADGSDGAPAFDAAWLAGAAPGFEWLWPPDGHGPAIPSVRIAIKHDPGDDIELRLDGVEVNPRNFSEKIVNDDGTIAVTTWSGVDLVEGDNLFEAVATDGAGRTERIEQTLHYSGSPVYAELIPGESWLVADGTGAPVVAVRLTDKDGFPAREGVIGGLSIDPPYESFETLEALSEYPLAGTGSREPTYVVDENGIAYVELAPTTRAGEAVLRFRLLNGEHEIRAWLEPAVSDWILVGLAEGTLGYETVKQNTEDLDATEEASDYYDDGRIAFFARGRIQGQWLLTVALDTAKDDEEIRRRFFQTIDPDAYYTLYGDATWQGYAAASSKPVYVKLERSQFYALYGDYVTGLTVTELSRYSRTMTGAKTELSTEHVALNAFASETDQAFVKDEIRGDGTSGLYQLTRRNLALNSEKVSIQTRDRYHSEVIVAEKHLIRHIDYDIDYDLGTLFFKEPVPSQDHEFNPNWIVVDYESYDSTDGAWNYGGRAALRTRGRTAELGGSYVHEGTGGRESDLMGVDATVWLGRETELRGEYATTTTELPSETIEGEAYLAELAHRSGRADGRIYFREQGQGFGVGQQNATETATRKLGLDATGRFGAGLSADVVAYRQTNLITEAERDVGEGRLGYGNGPYTLRAGYRYAVDRFADDTEKRSEQVTVGASAKIAGSRLTLRADHAQSIRGRNANPAYPTRTVLGADFKVADPITIFGEHEMLTGDAYDAETSRVGIKANPWRGAQVSSAYQQRLTENGARSFATLGLRQSWQVHERWSLDAGVDHARTIQGSGNRPAEGGLIPPTIAQQDFTAVSAGLAFRAPTWGWTTRGEHRTSDTSEKWTGAAGIYGEPSRGLGLSAHALVFRNEGSTLGDVTRGNVRLGLVYRPEASRWTLLDRLDLTGEERGVPAAGVSAGADGWRIVNNLHVNYRATHRLQVGAQYGAKYVQQDLGTDHFEGYTDLGGFECRYDITPRWDVGIAAGVLHSRNLRTYDYRTGASIGWNAFENAWISVGYNFTGFEDEDFSEAGFTARGPFVRFRLKFDQMSIRELLGGSAADGDE